MNGESFPRTTVFQKTLHRRRMRLLVCPTTGGRLELSVSPGETVQSLKCNLARKLKVQEEKFSLLFKSRLLKHGSLEENELIDGSRLTLLPNMETGTMNMTPDARVMQALETLSDSQVNDFLSGRSPLLLAMKLGEHMMFVQLQLSMASCNGRRSRPAPPAPQGVACAQAASGSRSAERNNSFSQRLSPESSGPETATPGQTPPCSSSTTPGAVIDSVSHLGQGVYSGTFSGTLDPSIQGSNGKPKRDISTILQILNDLLVASPQFRQQAPPCMHQATSGRTSPLYQSNIGQYRPSSPKDDSLESSELRGKVQRLQMMMRERKLRRQEKRGTRAPYMWADRRSAPLRHPGQRRKQHLQKFEQTSCRDSLTKAENLVGGEAAPFGASTSTMEHESVYV